MTGTEFVARKRDEHWHGDAEHGLRLATGDLRKQRDNYLRALLDCAMAEDVRDVRSIVAAAIGAREVKG